MPAEQQLSLPFACLDFPCRETVTLGEISAKLRFSVVHIWKHVDVGNLRIIDGALTKSRRAIRVPVDEYRRWVMTLLTGPGRTQLVEELPDAVARELYETLRKRLAA